MEYIKCYKRLKLKSEFDAEEAIFANILGIIVHMNHPKYFSRKHRKNWIMETSGNPNLPEKCLW